MLTFVELWPGGPKFAQHDGAFKITTDSILLAYFANMSRVRRCVDLGSGTGIITVLLAEKNPHSIFDSVEISEEALGLSKANFEVNNLEGRTGIIAGDIRDHRRLLKANAYDLVVSNPPYFPKDSGAISPLEGRDYARAESHCTLDELCSAAAFLCRYGGNFAMVHRPERLSEIFCSMTKVGIEPKRLRLVSARANASPNLVLIEGRRGGKPGLKIEAPLIIYDENGEYTEELKKIYKQA